MSIKQIQSELRRVADKDKAKILQGFFKTEPGQYGAGDKFLGIVVPTQRQLAKKYVSLSLTDLEQLLQSPYHEERLTALLILSEQFKQGNELTRQNIYKLYLKNTKQINNWDLVDLTAPAIVGGYLVDKDRKILYKLAHSKDLWDRRIAVLATFYFIRAGDSKDTLAISKLLLNDRQDLIHKAVGWMLREVGKKVSKKDLTDFLDEFGSLMPRTMLRYAIERLPELERKKYLKIK